jgi:hypothetical protein
MPKGSGGHRSSSSHFQSSGFRSSSHRNAGRGIGLAGRNFIRTAIPGTIHTLVLIGGQVYTGTYTGVVDGGLIRLAGVTIPGVGTVTLLVDPNAVVAYTP